jgi:hypothetical protein
MGLGHELSPKPTSHYCCAPTVIAKQPEAKRVRRAELVAAFERLLTPARRLRFETLHAGQRKEVLRFG